MQRMSYKIQVASGQLQYQHIWFSSPSPIVRIKTNIFITTSKWSNQFDNSNKNLILAQWILIRSMVNLKTQMSLLLYTIYKTNYFIKIGPNIPKEKDQKYKPNYLYEMTQRAVWLFFGLYPHHR